MREVLAAETRAPVDDGYGNPVSGGWVEQFRMAARIVPLRGGEAVTAERLQGRQPMSVEVHYSAQAARITTEWRLRDTRSGVTYNITNSVPREKRDYIDILCVAGGNDG